MVFFKKLFSKKEADQLDREAEDRRNRAMAVTKKCTEYNEETETPCTWILATRVNEKTLLPETYNLCAMHNGTERPPTIDYVVEVWNKKNGKLVDKWILPMDVPVYKQILFGLYRYWTKKMLEVPRLKDMNIELTINGFTEADIRNKKSDE